MPIQTSYTEARANLAKLLDQVTDDRQKVIINRRGRANVVLIAEDELAGLEETAYLLRSPKNAARLLEAYARTRQGTEKPGSVANLRSELGIGPKDWPFSPAWFDIAREQPRRSRHEGGRPSQGVPRGSCPLDRRESP